MKNSKFVPMDKHLVIMGIFVMVIGIGFLMHDLVEATDEKFWIGAGIWTVGGIATVLGLTVFRKEEGLNIH